MLVVSSSVGMLHGVHGHTAHLWPTVALGLVLVVGAPGLQHGLVDATASGHDAHHGAVGRRHHLLGAGGQLDTGALRVGVVGDDGGVVAGRTRQLAAVASLEESGHMCKSGHVLLLATFLFRAHLLLQVGDDGSLRHGPDGHDVAHRQLGLLAAVDELAGVHALTGHEQLLAGLVAVGVPEKYEQFKSTFNNRRTLKSD